MPYSGDGFRHTAVATKACKHGQLVVEDGFVGSAFKVDQPDRFVRPADYADIEVGEDLEIQINDVCSAPASGPLSAADVGSLIWIDPDNNNLSAVSSAAAATGDLPVGVVTEVDTGQSPAALLINTKVWQPFLAAVA